MGNIRKLIEFNNKYWLLITSTLLLLVTYASLRPLEIDFPPNSDKTLHLLSYLIVALPSALRNHRLLLVVVLLILLWSACIELIQPYVGRTGEWLDLLANGCGLLIGMGIGLVISKTLGKFDK